jgi:plastocyanin
MDRARIYNVVGLVFVLAVLGALGTEAYGGFWGSGPAAAKGSGTVERGRIAVAMRGLAFPDGVRTVAVGTTVVWTNFDGANHTVTATDKSFDSGNKTKGQTYIKTFSSIGKYAYVCTIHPFMVGSITVVQPYGTG